MTDIKLTGRQRSMLCWLAATDGLPPRDEGVNKTNPQLAGELLESLRILGLLCNPESVPGGWKRRPTEEALAFVERTRYSKNGCPACVQVHCVCNYSLVCVAGCGNAGCHGSHD